MRWKVLFEPAGWVQLEQDEWVNLEDAGRVGEPGKDWTSGLLEDDWPRVGVPGEYWTRGVLLEEDLP